MTRKDTPDSYDLVYSKAFNYGWDRAMRMHGKSWLDEIQLTLAIVEDEGEPSSVGDEGELAALRSIERAQIARMEQTYQEMPSFILGRVQVRLLKEIEAWNALISTNVGHQEEHQRKGGPWDLYWADQLDGPITRYRKELVRLKDRLTMVREALRAKP